MGHDKVRAMSSARLRLDPRVLRQAEALARSAGVSVSELIELLLLGLLDAEASELMPAPRHAPARQPPRASRKRAPGRVIVMDGFRRRAGAAPTREATPSTASGDIRCRSWALCLRAERARARSATARAAAGRARETARRTLEELSRVVGLVS